MTIVVNDGHKMVITVGGFACIVQHSRMAFRCPLLYPYWNVTLISQSSLIYGRGHTVTLTIGHTFRAAFYFIY